MSLAETIRNHISENIIAPARARGETRLTISVGEIHTALDLKHRVPSICSVLGANKFQLTHKMRLIERVGPANGSLTEFTFDLTMPPEPVERKRKPRKAAAIKSGRKPGRPPGKKATTSPEAAPAVKKPGFFKRLFGG